MKLLVYLSALSALVVNRIRMQFISMILLLISISLSSFSQDNDEILFKDPSHIISQVNLFSQKTTSITADFTQVKEMSFMEEKVTSTGIFYFQKENLMRWEYSEPFAYAIILNGDRIRIIDEGKVKDFDAGSNRIFMEISQVMTGMVNGTLLNSNQFNTTWFEAEGYYKAEMVPSEAVMKQYLTKIELKINKKDYSVDELKMFEKSGDYTHIIFRNKRLNETVPADIFRLD